MPINSLTTTSIWQAGYEVMQVDSAGRLKLPYQPAFYVKSGATPTAANIIIPGGTVIFNIGSHYNAGNGRFTAPVAGVYHFLYHQLAPNANTGRFDVEFLINGAEYLTSLYIYEKTVASWRTLMCESIMYLQASDYVNAYYRTGPAALYSDSNYGSFSGYMVG
jgi:hypothetical protein